MRALTSKQQQVHELATRMVRHYLKTESNLVEVLQQVEQLKIHHALGKISLFAYAHEILGLERSVAYMLITVARKAREIPALQAAIRNKVLTAPRASRIVSSMTSKNADELIRFASKHTKEQIDFEMAKRNPKTLMRDSMKPLSEEYIEVKVVMKRSTFEKLKRAKSLEAQKNKSQKWGDVLDAALDTHLDKHDPVRKATRATERKVRRDKMAKSETYVASTLSDRVGSVTKCTIHPKRNAEGFYERIPLTAEQKHIVNRRDQGRCREILPNGQRCCEDKWTAIHHIVLVSQGGTNDPENLITLCGFHHDLRHQLELPLDTNRPRLRSRVAAYGVNSVGQSWTSFASLRTG